MPDVVHQLSGIMRLTVWFFAVFAEVLMPLPNATGAYKRGA
jgi:hypothetical protein